ncbi:MAG: hypothetical protein JWO91_1431, partial [Acidobacteriaceae bacterium]|nr:hypothetical protein [Acidobacteriaceae bacterium]
MRMQNLSILGFSLCDNLPREETIEAAIIALNEVVMKAGLIFVSLALAFTLSSFGSTVPAVAVLSPAAVGSGSPNTTNFRGPAPIHYVAFATSPDCASGISSLQIYTATGVLAYSTRSSFLDVQLPLSPGFYNTQIKAWDNCGGVSSAYVQDYIQSSSGKILVNQPISNFAYAPGPIYFSAAASTSCPKGVAAMGVYTAPHHKVLGQQGNVLNQGVALSAGTYNVVVEEWDNCGGAATTPITLVVNDNGFPGNVQYAYIPDASNVTIDGFY